MHRSHQSDTERFGIQDEKRGKQEEAGGREGAKREEKRREDAEMGGILMAVEGR